MNLDEPNIRDYPWYAIHVRSRSEALVSTILRCKGYQEFLPTYRASHRWSDRIKELDLPLFPGYLFCRLDIERRLPILITPGVISFVGAGKTPIPVSVAEVNAIQTIISSGLATLPWPSLAVGEKVLIERGPLAGLEGIAMKVDKKTRLVVSVSLLQRSVAVDIERGWARPIRDGKGLAEASAMPLPSNGHASLPRELLT